MDRIKTTFQRLAEKNEAALVGFITAGDPTLDKSRRIALEMCRSGLDVLELGVPFSDPTADGPVIQRSSARALESGTTLEGVFSLAAAVRQASEVPLIMFSYYNPLFVLGAERFYRRAVEAGVDGVLIVDLPPEESAEFTSGWPGKDLSLIRLVAPTTPEERTAVIAGTATGFIYLVSMTGVTGSGGLKTSSLAGQCRKIRQHTDLPVCIGFGISTAGAVSEVSRVADGVVIGSAFEKTIEENLDHPDPASLLAEQVRRFKQATRRA